MSDADGVWRRPSGGQTTAGSADPSLGVWDERRWASIRPGCRLLELARERVEEVLGAGTADELDAQRQSVRPDPSGHSDRGLPGDVEHGREWREAAGDVNRQRGGLAVPALGG